MVRGYAVATQDSSSPPPSPRPPRPSQLSWIPAPSGNPTQHGRNLFRPSSLSCRCLPPSFSFSLLSPLLCNTLLPSRSRLLPPSPSLPRSSLRCSRAVLASGCCRTSLYNCRYYCCSWNEESAGGRERRERGERRERERDG